MSTYTPSKAGDVELPKDYRGEAMLVRQQNGTGHYEPQFGHSPPLDSHFASFHLLCLDEVSEQRSEYYRTTKRSKQLQTVHLHGVDLPEYSQDISQFTVSCNQYIL